MAILSGDIRLVESAVMEDVADATHTPSHHPYVATVRLIEV